MTHPGDFLRCSSRGPEGHRADAAVLVSLQAEGSPGDAAWRSSTVSGWMSGDIWVYQVLGSRLLLCVTFCPGHLKHCL